MNLRVTTNEFTLWTWSSLVFQFCRFWAWSSPWQCSASQWKWRLSTPRTSTSVVLRTFGLFLIKKDKYSLCSRSFSSPSSSSSISSWLFFPTLVPSVTFQLRCHKFTVFLPPLLTTNKHSVSVIPEFYGFALCLKLIFVIYFIKQYYEHVNRKCNFFLKLCFL